MVFSLIMKCNSWSNHLACGTWTRRLHLETLTWTVWHATIFSHLEPRRRMLHYWAGTSGMLTVNGVSTPITLQLPPLLLLFTWMTCWHSSNDTEAAHFHSELELTCKSQPWGSQKWYLVSPSDATERTAPSTSIKQP